MINYTYESLLATSSVEKDYLIEVYNDSGVLESSFTDEDLYSEEIERYNPLCTDQQLYIGACEASHIKFKVRNTVSTLKGKKLLVFVKPTGNQYTDWLQLGEYYVDTDELAGDRQSREIMAYDKLYKIINTDCLRWYREVGLPMPMKDFRDAFFNYFGVEQVETTLCNDEMAITEVEEVADQMSGLDLLTCILSGNASLGAINNEGKFRYITFEDYDIINYEENFEQGSLVYEDYTIKSINKLTFRSNKLDVVIEDPEAVDINEYIMEDNFLFYDKLEEDLTPYVQNIYDIISVIPNYRPLKAGTLGNPCVEVGDMISFKTTSGDTISTFVLEKIEKGLQGLRDNFETQGREYFEYDLNDGNSKIRNLWNNTIELVSTAKCYVYAHRNNLSFNIGPTGPATIITIPLATETECIPVFIATIPLVMDRDGEITFRYFLDDIEINEADTDTIYLTKGEQFVTISTFFEIDANVRKRFTVTAQAGYRESVERQQTAKILSLKDWIDNQSITVSGSTATFDYDYVEQPVDETPPVITIGRGEIRAEIFGSGLAGQQPWDGTIRIIEELSAFDLNDNIGFSNITENLVFTFPTNHIATGSDIVSEMSQIEVNFSSIVDDPLITLHADVFALTDETGEDALVIEEDDETRLYTEGDED